MRAFVISAVFFIVSAVLSLPWTIYSGWWRETAYGRTSQPLGDFLGQAALSAAITSVIAAVFMLGVYWLIRRTGKRWWIWSGALTASVLAVIILLSPILIEPLFNKYEPVPPGQVRDAVVTMAGRAGIPPDKIYMFNGSRQSNNFTANAGGVGNTARVAISDVALKCASLDEVRAVTGHEIGHYVLKHTWYGSCSTRWPQSRCSGSPSDRFRASLAYSEARPRSTSRAESRCCSSWSLCSDCW